MPSILIVDDEQHIRMLLEQTIEEFEDEGYEIFQAENGRVAMEMVKVKKPGLIFLDVTMPEVNGYDFCEKLRKEFNFRDIYVIMLTARGQDIDRQKGFDSGVNDYITKPFDPDEVVKKVRKVFPKK